MTGSVHDDRLWGSDQDNLLKSGAGNDLIRGVSGVDRLLGEAGDDLLAGGRGADVLTGGAGGDVFLFGLGEGRDRIRDFSVLEGDRLVLDAGLGLAGMTGAEVVDRFGILVGGSAVLRFSACDRIVFDGVTDLLALGASIDVI